MDRAQSSIVRGLFRCGLSMFNWEGLGRVRLNLGLCPSLEFEGSDRSISVRVLWKISYVGCCSFQGFYSYSLDGHGF